MPRAPTRGCGALRGALTSGPALVGARGRRPPLTSRHHEADVLHSQHRQLFLRVHADDPVGEPVHGQDAAARGLVAVIRRPGRAAVSHGDGGSASWPRTAPERSQSCAYTRGPAFSVLAYLGASGVCKSICDVRRHCSIPGTHPHMSPPMAVPTPSLCEATSFKNAKGRGMLPKILVPSHAAVPSDTCLSNESVNKENVSRATDSSL